MKYILSLIAVVFALQATAQDTVYVYIEVPADSAFCIQYLEEAYNDGWQQGYELAQAAFANPCPADLDGNGTITTSDLLLFLGVFSLNCDDF